MSLKTGTYKIVSAESGEVLTLPNTEVDNSPLTCCKSNGGNNQKWTLRQVDKLWNLRNYVNGSHPSTVALRTTSETPIIGSSVEFLWVIQPSEQDKSRYRISPAEPGAYTNITMMEGSEGKGASIQLFDPFTGPAKNQDWYFEQVED
ncbi:hypothetical protein TWF694_006888 [Orbilia ellipsospora]|uniref:Ricin B lectin domain-containing protein n=1 Tax=Orbilia ellipsospora TaxID=2528407 RepID=A0AAV9XN16_9PEZI